MNILTRTAFALVLGAALVGSATAATVAKGAIPTRARCDELVAQFDAAKASHAGAKRYTTALQSRDEGAKLCRTGDVKAGIASLDRALQDIGVKPVQNKS